MPGGAIARSWKQGAAWPRVISHAARGEHEQRSTSGPSPFGWSAAYVINILPLKAQIKRRVSRSPPLYHPFKLEVCFCQEFLRSPQRASTPVQPECCTTLFDPHRNAVVLCAG